MSTTLKRTPIYEPGQQSPVAGTPWIDLVREKYPNVTIDYQDMIRSTELFFVKQKIKSKSTISACGLHCNVIPFGKEAEFLRNFKSLYVKSRIVDKDAPIDEDEPLSSIADETSQLVSLIEDERIANKTIKDFYVFSWRDLVSVRHQNSDLLQVRSLVYKRILQGVDSFVKEHIPRLGCTVDECQIRSTNGSITSFGIPIQFVDAFYSWFDKQLEDRFSKYSVQAPANSTASERQSNASSSSDTKKSSASSAMQSQSCGTLDGPSTKKHKTSEKSSRKKKKRKNNVADPPVFGGYTDLPSVLNVTPNEDPIANQEAPSFAFVDVVPRCTKGSDTSSQAPAQSDSVQLAASAVLGTVDLNVEPPADVSSKKKLLRYNLIITEMMPKFGDLSKEIRYAFKDKVKDFIVCKLGSESRLSENVIQLRAQGTAFSTYGICREWIPEFKKWCLQELRSLFGVEQVPIQAWEQSSILGSCKV